MLVPIRWAGDKTVGVFASRSPVRPNPIGLSPVRIHRIVGNEIITSGLDVFDGTPVIDIKPYIPISDRIRDFRVANWMQAWPQWMEDAGAYFAQHPVDFGE